MADITYWKGLSPLYSFTGYNHSFPTETFQAAAGAELFVGQAVKLDTNGLVAPMDQLNATEIPLGVVAGLFYPTDGRPVNTQHVTAAQNSVAVAQHYQGIDFTVSSGVGVMVYVDPTIVYAARLVEPDGTDDTIAQAQVGDLAALIHNDTYANGTKVAVDSVVDAFAATAATAGGVMRIVGVPRTNNTNVDYATTNISTDVALVNKFGSVNGIVAVKFDFTLFSNPYLPALKTALDAKVNV